jgi:signal transduction histidine kinase
VSVNQPSAAPPPPAGDATPTAPAGAASPARAGLLPAGIRLWLLGWPAIAQLVCDLLLSAPYLIVAGLAVAALVTLPLVIVGVPMLVAVLACAWASAYLERGRLLAVLGVDVPPPLPPPADQPLWRRALFDSRLWRSLAHMIAIALWGLAVGSGVLAVLCVSLALAAVPLYFYALPAGGVHLPWNAEVEGPWWYLLLTVIGLTGLLLLPLLARVLVIVDVLLARWLLGPTGTEEVERLEARVETLTQTRVATVDSVEVERRRIERDLHDGPQQRLVAIAMDLGMARERLSRDPDGARELLDKAHAASKEAITEMRQVARGIAPPVLTDRGLDAALSALAARSPVPVGVDVRVPVRPTPTLEAIAYFCVSEALTNVAKHARASAARVDVRIAGELLEVHISDNGIGGADADRGTGLHGLGDRVRAVDGSIEVTSPEGGPTAVVVRLPMRPARPAWPGPAPPTATAPAPAVAPAVAAAQTAGPSSPATPNPGSPS